MSRIIAGVAGGHRLHSVPGDKTRPTTDRVKEALFSRLEAYEVISGSRVLDLFAGSGALGLEALSRGAVHVDFCDSYSKAVATVKKNLELIRSLVSGDATVLSMTAHSLVNQQRSQGWDVVFMDPPYPLENTELEDLLRSLIPSLAEGAVIVVERSTRTPEPAWPVGLGCFATKKYGETTLYYVEPVQAGRDDLAGS